MDSMNFSSDTAARNKMIASIVVILIAMTFVVWQLWPSGKNNVIISTDAGSFETTFRDELTKKGYYEFQYVSVPTPPEGETTIVIAGTVKNARDLETVKAVAAAAGAAHPQVKYRVDTLVKP